MQYPPDEWAIKCDDLFGAYSLTGEEEDLTCQLMLQVNRAARLEGGFKILLGGSQPISVDISAQQVLIMGGAASYRLVMERWPRDIILLDNSTTSAWFDLEDRYLHSKKCIFKGIFFDFFPS
jgi:hypothetical protein